MKYFGCSYYPEDFGLERIAEDIKLMKECGMNMVRMGEFAWSNMEKRPGEFDFELFQKAIEIFGEHGIDVMMCTPTAAPPAWLTHLHPETLVVDAAGHRAMHGIRQQCCYNSPVFREFSRRITDELTQKLADYRNIVAWQVDNELGQRLAGACSCDVCQEGFRNYLREKYRTISNLNKCWKTTFWSHDYSNWDEILLAFPECLWWKNPQVIHYNYSVSRVLDSLRFYDRIVKEYLKLQGEVIKRNIPGAIVTTNNPIGILDLKSLYQELDFAAGDFYRDKNDTPSIMAERLARYRSYKEKNFFVNETGPGYDYLDIQGGQKIAKLDMWRSFAYGAISYLVFRWRPPLGGQEQTALCPLSPAGRPRHTYQVVKEMFTQANSLKKKLKDISLPVAPVAILFDSDVQKCYLQHGYGRSIRYENMISDVFHQMHQRNIPAVFVSPESSLNNYRLLVLPSPRIIRKELSQRIKTFVRNGGTVWAIGEVNTADENGNFTTDDWPMYLGEVFGVRIHTGAPIPESAKIHVFGRIGGKQVEECINGCWLADLESKGAEVLLRFADGYYQGQEAVTHHRYGKGHVYYQGISTPGSDLLFRLSEDIINTAGISYFSDCPAGVEMIDCGPVVFFINNNDYPVSFTCPLAGRSLMGRFMMQTGKIEIEAFDICIIKKSEIK